MEKVIMQIGDIKNMKFAKKMKLAEVDDSMFCQRWTML